MQQKIIDAHLRMIASIREKNGTYLQEAIRNDFIFTSATAELWSKDKFINGFVLNPQIGFPEFVSQEQQVVLHDGTAVVTALVYIKITRSKGTAAEELWERTTETYVKSGPRWELLAMQATFLPQK